MNGNLNLECASESVQESQDVSYSREITEITSQLSETAVVDESAPGASSERQSYVSKEISASASGLSFSLGTTSGNVQSVDAANTKQIAYSSEGDFDDARSTSSSHPFSSPNTSEQDDAHGGNEGCLDSRKAHRRRRHFIESNIGAVATTIMPGNRPPFPLSERQQMALAMQLSAQDHPTGADQPACSPSTPSTTTPSTIGNRSRGKLAKVHRRNERGETPLHLAAKRGEFQHCRELIDDGADVNCVDYAGWTPLHEACNQGWYKTAKVLVEHGANVDVRGLDDDTPLHDAAVSGHKKLVILLLQHGADPMKYNKQGKRPVDVADDSEIVRLMMEGPPKCSSPTSSVDYSFGLQIKEDEEKSTSRNDLDKTLTAEDIGFDSSAVGASFGASECRENTETPLQQENKEFLTDPNADDYSAPKPESRVSPMGGSAAFLSTESENEQRLVVDEGEHVDEQQQQQQHQQQQHAAGSTITPVESSPTASTAAGSGNTRMEGGGEGSARPMRPARHTAYMKQRRLERAAGTSGSGLDGRWIAGATGRGKRRKSAATVGAKSNDVYEFHSSDSDEEREESGERKLRKYPKLSVRMKRQAAARTSGGETSVVGSMGIGDKNAMEVDMEKKQEDSGEMEKTCGVELEPVSSTAGETCTGDPAPAVSANMLKSGLEENSSQNLPTTSKNMENDPPSIAVASGNETKTGTGNGSRKERLLGFGRRRTLGGDQKNQKEREAHIENVVASIGSGLTATVDTKSTETTAGVGKSGIGEQQQKNLKSRVGGVEGPVTNEQEDVATAGSLKVPPLKLVLAGRSNSDEDSNSNACTTREAIGRTYIVQSRTASPSSERRSSSAADLADASQTLASKSEDNRKTSSGNGTNPAGTTGTGGNGGEGTQRVTRSQVRLHGVQLDRNTEESVAMHPRKRKLRSAKTMIEPVAVNRTLMPVVSPSLAAIAVKNSYEAHQHMKKEIMNKWRQEMNSGPQATTTTTSAPVNGFENFLLVKKTYLIQDGGGCVVKKEESLSSSSSLPSELIELKKRQSEERQQMQIRHRVERERLMMSCEREAIREHNRYTRGTPEPAMNVMRLLRDADLYNPLQLDKDVPFLLAATTGQETLANVGEATARFGRAKKQLVGRQKLESQCLYATQTQEWETKLKLLLLHSTDEKYCIHQNVVQVGVIDDFPLLPSSPISSV